MAMRPALLPALLLLSACGGGGGSSSPNPPPAQPSPVAPIVGTWTATATYVSGTTYVGVEEGDTATFTVDNAGDVRWDGAGPVVRLAPNPFNPSTSFQGSRPIGSGSTEAWNLNTSGDPHTLRWVIDPGGDAVHWDIVRTPAANG